MNRRIHLTRGDRAFEIIGHIVCALVVFATLYPLYFVLIASFSSPNDVMLGRVSLWPVNFNLRGYQLIFSNPNIWLAYRNTILYTLSGTVISLGATLAAAFVLSRRKLYGARVCMLLILFTMYFSGGLIPGYFNIRNLGMLNTIWAIILPGAISGYNLIIARTFMQNSIPESLDEAAEIDGCAPIRYFITIILPLSLPIIGVLCLYIIVGHWNSYYNALIYLTERKNYPLQLVLREILVQSNMSADNIGTSIEEMEDAFEFLNLSESLKYGLIVISSVPMLILYPFLQKFFVKGIMIGSIKG